MELPRTTRAPGRRLYLDWLRIVIVFWLIPFHTARIYSQSTNASIRRSIAASCLRSAWACC